VIAVPEDGVESRQVVTMALDARRTALQIGPNIGAADASWSSWPCVPNGSAL
jgi:hypothetical protein